jgi:hypothetical protein
LPPLLQRAAANQYMREATLVGYLAMSSTCSPLGHPSIVA